MTTETINRIEFEGAQGDLLAARLDLPKRGARAYALFAHCFTCSKDLTAVFRISRALARKGLGVLRFDFTGLGHSEGEFANTNFSSNVQDLIHAAAWLRGNYEAPTLLIGHSLGGAAVLAAAPQIPECKAIATIAAPSEPAHLAHLLPTAIEDIEEDGQAEVTLGGRRFTVKRQLLEDLRSYNLHDKLPDLGRALLVMHSPQDEIVDLSHALRIFDAAPQPKSFLSIGGADHLLTNADDAEYAADVLGVWVGPYVSPVDPDPNA